MKHFGGVDSPSTERLFSGGLHAQAKSVLCGSAFRRGGPGWQPQGGRKKDPGFGESREPLTRNRWVEIRYKDKSCYAQWQDVGPMGEDDFDGCSGTPRSPRTGRAQGRPRYFAAAAQYLGVEGSARTEWRFVDEAQVPGGPWKTIVTR